MASVGDHAKVVQILLNAATDEDKSVTTVVTGAVMSLLRSECNTVPEMGLTADIFRAHPISHECTRSVWPIGLAVAAEFLTYLNVPGVVNPESWCRHIAASIGIP